MITYREVILSTWNDEIVCKIVRKRFDLPYRIRIYKHISNPSLSRLNEIVDYGGRTWVTCENNHLTVSKKILKEVEL